MLRVYLLALLLVCNMLQAQHNIIGNLAQYKNQKIVLYGFNYEEKIELASTTIDSIGNFKLNYTESYNGIAVLSILNKEQVLFVLTEPKLHLDKGFFDRTSKFPFTNSKENSLFFNYKEKLKINQQILPALQHLSMRYYDNPLLKKQKKIWKLMKKEQERIKLEEEKFIASLPKTSYLSWFLPLYKLMHDMPLTANVFKERISKNITTFRTINFKDNRFKNSGIYEELIRGHYIFLGAVSKPMDTGYIQMNKSTRYLINSLKDDKIKLNKTANFLFNFLEKRSYFKASEYLSLTLLEEHYDLLERSLINKLEGYRKLKIGNIAPDIDLDATTKLSDIKKTTLLVFVASWCPECKLTNERLFRYYLTWKNKGVEIIYFSVDTDKNAFETVYANAPWKVYSDFKGWESTPIKDFYVSGTPTFFLLNEELKILSRPKSVEQINAIIKNMSSKVKGIDK